MSVADLPSLDPRTRKTTLRKITNGMYVLTSRRSPGAEEGERPPYGAATVTWLSQCSFTPPMVMVAIRPASTIYDCMLESRVGAVHVVERGQEAIAQKFFTPSTVDDERINGERFRPGVTGSPILENVGTWFECEVAEVVEPPGDHAIFLLEVVAVEDEGTGFPLTVTDSPWEYGG